MRPVVAGSWQRSRDAGVDPDRPAPRVLGDRDATELLEAHPLRAAVRALEAEVFALTHATPQLVAFADDRGTLLWVDGHPRALRSAVAPRFLAGFSCEEGTTGTNAVGTALALASPVQIVSAEHWARGLHGWTSAAAPITDPRSGRVVGAVGVSGPWDRSTPESLTVARLLSRAASGAVAAATAAEHERLRRAYTARIARPMSDDEALLDRHGAVVLTGSRAGGADHSPTSGGAVACEPFAGGSLVRRHPPAAARAPSLRIVGSGADRVAAVVDGTEHRLSPRSSELLVLLAMHPRGIGAGDLSAALYARPAAPVTLRSDLSRLRAAIGPVFAGRPIRLQAELEDAATLGALLPASRAPGLAR